MLKYTLPFLSLVLAYSAHAQDRKIAEMEPRIGPALAPTALVISFDSIGTGINKSALNTVLRYIQSDLKSGTIDAVYSRKAGLEGERELCLQYSHFSKVVEVEKHLYEKTRTSTQNKPAPRYERMTDCEVRN